MASIWRFQLEFSSNNKKSSSLSASKDRPIFDEFQSHRLDKPPYFEALPSLQRLPKLPPLQPLQPLSPPLSPPPLTRGNNMVDQEKVIIKLQERITILEESFNMLLEFTKEQAEELKELKFIKEDMAYKFLSQEEWLNLKKVIAPTNSEQEP